jgi:hypothetical protein
MMLINRYGEYDANNLTFRKEIKEILMKKHPSDIGNLS